MCNYCTLSSVGFLSFMSLIDGSNPCTAFISPLVDDWRKILYASPRIVLWQSLVAKPAHVHLMFTFFLQNKLKLWVRMRIMAGCTRYNFVIKFATGLWFSLGTLISSINKTDRHNIAEILLKVALNTISLTLTSTIVFL